jgi:hypothetical protein
LGGANFDNGEFGGDEKAVKENEERHQQHLEDDFKSVVHFSPGEPRQKLL